MEDWSRAHWFVVLSGLADAHLWGFDVDNRWRLRHGSPANATLAILPASENGPLATLEDAVWLADCIAFDHDAPVGVTPSGRNFVARFPYQPVHPLPGADSEHWYFENTLLAFYAAAEARFGDSYSVRYDETDPRAPGTDFSKRLLGREERVALYAMAARQADVLLEYLCLYRVLEAADGGNGVVFATEHAGSILSHDFGALLVIAPHQAGRRTNAFDVYKQRGSPMLRDLQAGTVTGDRHVAERLYAIRNSLAHGKRDPRAGGYGASVSEVAQALPVVKLLARIAVEG